MPAATPSPRDPTPPESLPTVLAREGLRALAAFGLFLLLYLPWTWTGLARAYQDLVLQTAQGIFVRLQHFPVLDRIRDPTLSNLDFLVPFAVALFLVSRRVSWLLLLRRLALVLAAVFCFHVLTVVLQVKVTTSQQLLSDFDLLVLLPWEFRVVERAKYLLYDLGVQLGPFLLLLLTVAWNVGWASGSRRREVEARPAKLSRRKRRAAEAALSSRRRRRLATGVGLAALLCATLVLWAWWRERDPRHIEAHARLGSLFLRSGNVEEAAQHYRIAVSRNTTDPEAYYGLAGILKQRGESGQSTALLRRGLEVADDPEWKARLGAALQTGRATEVPPR